MAVLSIVAIGRLHDLVGALSRLPWRSTSSPASSGPPR